MARISHTSSSEQTSSNPTTRYMEWKSNDKCFSYFDKSLVEGLTDKDEIREKGNVKVTLPFKFLLFQHYHTVKGWHEASASGIYSNEVYWIGSEPITVRSFKGGVIAEGFYKDLKTKIANAGGKYHRSLYVMLEDGTVANISIKGSAVKEWGDFFKDNEKSADTTWFEVNKAKEAKKGSINYSVPVFSLGSLLSKPDAAKADNLVVGLGTYLNERSESYANQPEKPTFAPVEGVAADVKF
jgi:hypothetical protein